MAIIKKYQTEISQIIDHGDEVYTLEIKSLGRKFKFTPGQFLHLALDEYDPSEGWPESRCFSMQSSPGYEKLKITYSVKGDYTKRMASELRRGSTVQIKLPYGDLFDQQHNKERTIFIAGGTGITPYLSLFNDDTFSEYSNPILYLGLKSDKHNFYKEELEKANQINPSLKINYVIQNVQGVLNIEEIFSNCFENNAFFISGPPIMIKNFKEYLLNNGVDETRILTDDWE